MFRPPHLLWILLPGTLGFFVALGGRITAIEPANPATSDAARVVLDHLRTHATAQPGRIILGQNLGHGNITSRHGYDRYVVKLADETGKRPGLLGVDLGYNHLTGRFDDARDFLTRHWEQGGLVTLSMHPRNPWRGTDCHDTRVGPLDDLVMTGAIASLRWQADLERIGDALESLQQAGVVVLWRPFHEANGGWFWWGGPQASDSLGPREFRRLWRELFDYLTIERKLNNLLWVYSPSANADCSDDLIRKMYPGSDVVDIVGLDWYVDASRDSIGPAFQQLRQFGKPIGVCEFGPESAHNGSFKSYEILDRLMADYPDTCFVLYWHSWPDNKVALVDTADSKRVVNADFTVTIDGLPRVELINKVRGRAGASSA